MNESNNPQGRFQPIAKTTSQKPVTPKAPVAPKAAAAPKAPASAEENVFSSVYNTQKTTNENQEIEAQKAYDKEIEKAASIHVVNHAEVQKADDENKKFKIVFIILIIITAVLFLAASITLAVKLISSKSAPAEDEAKTPVNTISEALKSPFNYQKVYNVQFPQGMNEKYKDLYTANQDFVGWLTVPGTCIDTPVYQDVDSDQYYLKHDPYMTYTKYGVPYMDPDCDAINLSRNTTFHGHNFDDGLMFDELQNYENLEFYKQNPVITFSSLYKEYKFKVIAAFRSNGRITGDNNYLFYYIAPEFGNNSLMKFHDELLQRSYIHTGVDVQPDDKLITLSTCTYFFDVGGAVQNARFAVVGRLIREGESEYVDTSVATVNENVRYPQLYYDVFGGENPWVNSSKWVPEAD